MWNLIGSSKTWIWKGVQECKKKIDFYIKKTSTNHTRPVKQGHSNLVDRRWLIRRHYSSVLQKLCDSLDFFRASLAFTKKKPEFRREIACVFPYWQHTQRSLQHKTRFKFWLGQSKQHSLYRETASVFVILSITAPTLENLETRLSYKTTVNVNIFFPQEQTIHSTRVFCPYHIALKDVSNPNKAESKPNHQANFI